MKRIPIYVLIAVMMSVCFGQCIADTLTLPSQLKVIGDGAFQNDTSLDVVILPETIERIGIDAFAGSSLSRINLPASLEQIGDNAFEPGVRVSAIWNTWAWHWAVENGFIIPTQVTVEALNTDLYAISWNAVDDVEQYTVSIYADEDCTDLYLSAEETETYIEIYTDTGTQYWVVVSYESDQGYIQTEAVTSEPIEPLPAPEYLTAAVDEDGTVLLSWNPVEGADGYWINYSYDDPTWVPLMETIPIEEGTEYSGFHLEPDQTMFIWICAVNTDGPGLREWRVPNRFTEYDLEERVDLLEEGFQWDSLFIPEYDISPIDLDGITDPEVLADLTELNELITGFLDASNEYNAALGMMTNEFRGSNITIEKTDPEDEIFRVNLGDYYYPINNSDVSDALGGLTDDGSGNGDENGSEGNSAANPNNMAHLKRISKNPNLLKGSFYDWLDYEPTPQERAKTESRLRRINNNGSMVVGMLGLVDRKFASLDTKYFECLLKLRGTEYDLRITTVGNLDERFTKFWKGSGLNPGAFRILSSLNLGNIVVNIHNDWILLEKIWEIKDHGHMTELEEEYERSREVYSLIKEKYGKTRNALMTDLALQIWNISSIICGSTIGNLNPVVFAANIANTLANLGMDALGVRNRCKELVEEIKQHDSELHYDIFGYVTDVNGLPINGAEVGYMDGNFRRPLVYTDANGYYTIEVPDAIAYLKATKADFTDSEIQQVAVEAYVPAQQDFELESDKEFGLISGQVTDAETQLPIEGVIVTYEDISDVTNAGGVYTLRIPMDAEEDTKDIRIKFTKERYVSEHLDITLEKNTIRPGSMELYGCNEIYTREDLENIVNNPTGRYSLANDIDLSGTPWTPLSEFRGILDGKGFAITGMIVTESNNGNSGLFAILTGASIKNLNITDAVINVATNFDTSLNGILCARLDKGKKNNCTVEDSSFSGTITVYEGTNSIRSIHAGGIASYIEDGMINGCQINADINVRHPNPMAVGGICATYDNAYISNTDFNGSLSAVQTQTSVFTSYDVSILVNGIGRRSGGSLDPQNCNVSGEISGVGLNLAPNVTGLSHVVNGTNNALVYASSEDHNAFAYGCEACRFSTNNGPVTAISGNRDARAYGLWATYDSVNTGSISAYAENGIAWAIGIMGDPDIMGNTTSGSYYASGSDPDSFSGPYRR